MKILTTWWDNYCRKQKEKEIKSIKNTIVRFLTSDEFTTQESIEMFKEVEERYFHILEHKLKTNSEDIEIIKEFFVKSNKQLYICQKMTTYTITTELKTTWWLKLLRFLRIKSKRVEFNIAIHCNIYEKDDILNNGNFDFKIVKRLY